MFCEKPLAPTEEACLRIVEAEMAAGQRLVQVGFMRRYDAGYRALKAALEAGEIGAPLLMHCAHRNPSVPPYGFTTEMMVSDSAVHEIDLMRWLFGEDIVATNILKPRRSSKGSGELHDPLIVLLEMASGVLVDVEVFVNATTATTSAARSWARAGPWRWPRPAAPCSSRRAGEAVASPPTGGSASAGLRRRAAGLARGRGRRVLDRAQRLGRLRGHGRGGELPGGAADRQPDGGVAGRTPRLLREGAVRLVRPG